MKCVDFLSLVRFVSRYRCGLEPVGLTQVDLELVALGPVAFDLEAEILELLAFSVPSSAREGCGRSTR
jgi:hypothetical protein